MNNTECLCIGILLGMLLLNFIEWFFEDEGKRDE
jgi:hypothetical protein